MTRDFLCDVRFDASPPLPPWRLFCAQGVQPRDRSFALVEWTDFASARRHSASLSLLGEPPPLGLTMGRGTDPTAPMICRPRLQFRITPLLGLPRNLLISYFPKRISLIAFHRRVPTRLDVLGNRIRACHHAIPHRRIVTHGRSALTARQPVHLVHLPTPSAPRPPPIVAGARQRRPVDCPSRVRLTTPAKHEGLVSPGRPRHGRCLIEN